MDDQCLIGSKDFEEFLDKKIVILLWDGKYLFGVLRSYDQFNSLTIENTIERQFHGNIYCETNHGVFIVRGENVVVIGLSNIDLKGCVRKEYEEVNELIMKGSETNDFLVDNLNNLNI